MSNPNEPRFLPWRLRGSVSIQEQTPNEIIPYETVNDLFPLDPDEKTVIGMNLSLNEFVDLASVIDIGRDIGYPEQSINIWFKFVRAIQEAGSMVTCTDIADCLNDPVVFNVLINNNEFVETLVQNETFNNTLVQNSNTFNTWNVNETTGAERLPEHAEEFRDLPDPCNLDELWAGIREMVERIDQQGRDLLEDLSVLNDKAERVQGAIDLVPILGDIIADVSDFFTETIPDLLTAYNAFSSPTALDLVACDLFSMVCAECRYPTYDEVFEYFKNNTGLTLDNFATTNYLAVWTGIKVVSAVPEPVWMAVNTWQTFTLGFGGKWNSSYGKRTFAIWASFGEDLPNDNWIVLCDGCCQDPFTLEIPMDSPLVSVVERVWGTQLSDRIQNVRVGSNYKVEVKINFGGNLSVREYGIIYTMSPVAWSGSNIIVNDFGNYPAPLPATATELELKVTRTDLQTKTSQNIQLITSNYPSTSSAGFLYAIRIYGCGTVPLDMQPFIVS